MGVRFGAAAMTCAALFGTAVVATGCEQVQQATDRASICVDALKVAGFTPNLSDPAQAADDARQAAAELNSLAGQAPDQALKTALTDMAGTIGTFDPADAGDWLARKGRQLDALRRACT